MQATHCITNTTKTETYSLCGINPLEACDDSDQPGHLLTSVRYKKKFKGLFPDKVNLDASNSTADLILGSFSCFFLLSIDFFPKIHSGILAALNSLDPDQAQQNVGPDLGRNCLQRLSAMSGSRKFCQRGSNFDNYFFFRYRRYTTIGGPSLSRQRNAIKMAHLTGLPMMALH